MEQDNSRSKVWKKTIGKVRRGTGLLRYGMRRGRSKVWNKTIREASCGIPDKREESFDRRFARFIGMYDGKKEK